MAYTVMRQRLDSGPPGVTVFCADCGRRVCWQALPVDFSGVEWLTARLAEHAERCTRVPQGAAS